jgi:hypothetical protein
LEQGGVLRDRQQGAVGERSARIEVAGERYDVAQEET